MRKKIALFGLIGLVGMAGVFGSMLHVYAADDTTQREEIALSPLTQKYEIAAGESDSGSFTVLNNGDVEYDFKVYAEAYSVSGDYTPTYGDTTAKRADAYEWVKFDTTEATLAPHTSMEVNYTIDMPLDASLGGHYAVLFAETIPEEDGGNQIVRKKRVGMILRVNVSGDINESGSVTSSNISFFQPSPPLVTTMNIQNDGNVDFDIESTITVTDIFGSTKYTDTKSNIIFPDTTRTLERTWDGASWIGFYNVKLSAEYIGRDFETSKYVLILPRWLIALLVILIAGGAYAAFARHRR